MDGLNSFPSLLYGKYWKTKFKQSDWVIAEYVWIHNDGHTLRSKSRTIKCKISSLKDIPRWSFIEKPSDELEDVKAAQITEHFLVPVAYFLDPFRLNNNILVLCSVYDCSNNLFDSEPSVGNFRIIWEKAMRKVVKQKPWFGFEQEYYVWTKSSVGTLTPLGWPSGGYPKLDRTTYCSVGAGKAYGRVVMDRHYNYWLYAGIDIFGCNVENTRGQLEYQIGTTEGVKAADHLIMSRYILQRIAEDMDVVVSFSPKLFKGEWSGSGLHTNFSTRKSRKRDGIDELYDMIDKLEKTHK